MIQHQNDISGKKSIANYAATSVHETCHMMGLDDAYLTEEGYDRFTDNEETGVFYEKVNETETKYENVMRARNPKRTMINLVPNDLEMMFTAYQDSKGQSWWHYQAYKTYEENGNTYVISDCILNQTDYYND